MKLSKIVLLLAVVFTFVACATHAQDNRSFNYNAMSKAQLQNRINNAKVEYKHAKARTADAKASLNSAEKAYKQAKTSYQNARKNEKVKSQALKDAEKAMKYKKKIRKLSEQ
ncbi:MAG: hypothetical protein HXN41_02750 [Prevotella histicola]|uniref:hypothetical protein n=1 Tax=Prevotella histicola TaxID=470565 RepID=UPI001CB482F0|nr:hypothetical protein [Prevotella histicola]MBF1424663.1 hypothetical protein [Prevotella histicola]